MDKKEIENEIQEWINNTFKEISINSKILLFNNNTRCRIELYKGYPLDIDTRVAIFESNFDNVFYLGAKKILNKQLSEKNLFN